MNLLPVEQAVEDGVVIRGWRSENRGRSLIVFLHGNGFCGPVYLPMHTELEKEFDILMLDVPGQGLSDPIETSWNRTAELLHQALLRQQDILKPECTFGVGHSLGGVLTLLSAHRHPDTYQSLVLLDPVLFPPRMLFLMRVVQSLRLTSLVHPLVRPTLRRRRHWQSIADAREYLRGRKIFSGWVDDALQAYLDYALRPDSTGAVELRCDPETEARFFATLPDGLWRALRGVSCETRCVMGADTFPFALESVSTAASVNSNITSEVVPGGHCHMQQFPSVAAQLIHSFFTAPDAMQQKRKPVL